jgi:hypothetical protein
VVLGWLEVSGRGLDSDLVGDLEMRERPLRCLKWTWSLLNSRDISGLFRVVDFWPRPDSQVT